MSSPISCLLPQKTRGHRLDLSRHKEPNPLYDPDKLLRARIQPNGRG